MSKILVAVDDSTCASAATDYAGQLAELLNSAVVLVHAWRPALDLAPYVGGATVEVAGGQQPLDQFMGEQAMRTLDAHAERLKEKGIKAERMLVEGAVKPALLRAIEDGDYDMVVLGTHGRTGLKHAMLGSVAEWMVRHAPIPVVTVRQPE